MTRKAPVREKLAAKHSYNLRSRSNLPKVKHASGNSKNGRLSKESAENLHGISEQQRCVICMETRRFRVREEIPCGHIFHSNCMKQWMENANSCPICRKPVKQLPEQQRRHEAQSFSGGDLERLARSLLLKHAELRKRLLKGRKIQELMEERTRLIQYLLERMSHDE